MPPTAELGNPTQAPGFIDQIPANVLASQSSEPTADRFFYPEDQSVATEVSTPTTGYNETVAGNDQVQTLKPGYGEVSDVTVPRWRIRQIVAQMPESIEGASPFEFKAGGNRFELLGVTQVGNRPAYAFNSRDEKGDARSFFVYRSESEGGLRVSQAVSGGDAKDGNVGRFMKGAELAADSQYTQDTQLHPAIAGEIANLFPSLSESKLAKGQTAPNFIQPHTTVDALANDFETQTQVNVLGSEAVNKTLHELPKAGQLEQSRDWQEVVVKIGDLGRQLEAAGVVPDFSEPVATFHDVHPVLGEITREVYDVVVNGRPIEWHMAHDKAGRVWIDRIRFGDTQPTA
ncbi:MAG: hypothetical protein ABI221_00940, partial [Candidatus Saccharimonadales bacterium]